MTDCAAHDDSPRHPSDATAWGATTNCATARGDYAPILTRTTTYHAPVAPVAYDCIKLIFVRRGSASLYGELGQRSIAVGDVVALASNVLCGSEPDRHITVTTVYLDTDYVIDQVFWQYVGSVRDRLEAQDVVRRVYAEPAQVLHLGQDQAGLLMPWLDELEALSVDGGFTQHFYRMQALWFSIADVIVPYIATSPVRISPTQRATTRPSSPRLRQFAPLRDDARKIMKLLRDRPERTWRLSDMAEAVYLSPSQVERVFVDAYGKSPITYLTMLRVERMAHYLRTTDTPISVIAHLVGWQDADFAARQFRRSVGLTPSRYRGMGRDEQAAQRSG